MFLDFIARTTEDGREQTLEAHSQNVAKLTSEWAKCVNMPHIAYAAGLYHDSAKALDAFQSYIKNPAARRGSVTHSIGGAKGAVADFGGNKTAAEIIANIIASHHGGLRDFMSYDGEARLAEELRGREAEMHPAQPSGITDAMLREELNAAAAVLPDKPFGSSMLVKMLYSCLVDADRLDAYMFERGDEAVAVSGALPDWAAMLASLETRLSRMKTGDGMRKNSDPAVIGLRQKISEQCAASGLRERGIYKLEAPTGSGKTLSSLRFALTHAKKHGMSRIIYVIPYLSILSQTAGEIRESLGEYSGAVLEHHSNILPDDSEYYKLHTDRWDSPIILTTQVQLLESIFSARGSGLRKLHNMAGSIMIFDEVQSLPVKCVHLFNGAINFFNRVCGTTVLLCTATQPLLDKVERPVLMSGGASIAECGGFPQRTELVFELKPNGYTALELKSFVLERHNESTLIITNTKKAAKELYNALREEYPDVLHLSTHMCKKHRDEVITKLRGRLARHEPVICVSTQLIEAGIDISFECAVRDLAGLDSISQAAGRCNRHNEFGKPMKVYIVNIAGENLDRLEDIKIGAEVTRRLCGEGMLDIGKYYEYYFYRRRMVMDYPTRSGGSVFDLLSRNRQGFLAFKNREGNKPLPTKMTAAIKSAADEFFVIAPGQTEVVVPYGESAALLALYFSKTDTDARRRLLRELGQYTVSLYGFQTEELRKRGALSGEEGVTVLADGFYDGALGADISGSHAFLNV